MNILWQSVAPWHGTGYGTQTAGACKLLKELGHDVIISACYGLMEGGFVRWRGIPVHPGDKDWGSRHTKKYVDRFKSDIVISLQDIWPLPPGFGSDVPWYPWFPIDHNPIPPLVLERLQFARKPIVYSKFAEKQLKNKGIDCFYFPHGVGVDIFKPGEKLSFGEGKFVIGCVAVNSGLRKNLTGLVEAFYDFHKLVPESLLYIHTNYSGQHLGDTDLLNLSSDLDITDSVMFPDKEEYISGNFNDEYMAKLYNTFDVFCLPSRGEGFGIPIIEAQACGVPVIVTGETSMPELVGGGIVLKKLKREWTYQDSYQFIPDKQEIVNALLKIYETKDRSKMSNLAIRKANEYSWDKLKPLLSNLMNKIDEHRKQPLNREGVQNPRLLLIPKSIEHKKVLDIGSGVTRPYKIHLEQLGDYTAVDIEGGEDIVKADACHLPFNEKEFGFAWCSEVLEHVDGGAKQYLLIKEAKRVSDHGVIIFPTKHNNNFNADPGHNKIEVEYNLDCFGNGMIIW